MPPLCDPLVVAKQADSLDQLSGGRFLLGLSSGDRPAENPSFGRSFEDRAARLRDAVGLIRAATGAPFAVHASEHYGRLDGSLDLVPKPVSGRLPMLAIGRPGQDVAWLAEHLDGWFGHQTDFARLPEVIAAWRRAGDLGLFGPYGYGHWLDLAADPDAPMRIGRGVTTGRNALTELWRRQRDEGVSHVAIKLKIARRPARQVLDEFATHILPIFHQSAPPAC